jgi:hypothetical protein
MTTTIDNFDWLTTVGQHPETTNADLLAAFHIIGTPTDITPDQLEASTFRLHMLGFLRPVDISDDGLTYTYGFHIPEPAAR